MKIAILHPFLFRFFRGIERFTWALSKSLARRQVAVDLLTWRWPKPVNWGEIPARVRIRQVPDFRYYMGLAAVPFYVSWLARGRYDWVILFFAGYGEAQSIRIMRALRSQRYCVVFHFPREEVPHRYAEFERFDLARSADQLVAVSAHTAHGVMAQFGLECAVIGNGVDPGSFCPSTTERMSVRRRLGVAADDPVLISVAALEERKGIQWVIRALPRLVRQFPKLQYWVLGEGQYRAALRAQVAELGLERTVSFLGSHNDVVPFLASADVGCLLSHGEAFPLALLEYMAMELPVVTSPHPPFDEIVSPEWAEMVDETDPAGLAARIADLLTDQHRRRAMGLAARQSAIKHHTWDRVADSYFQLLANGPGAQNGTVAR